jgi:hypothetical protein
MVTYQVARLLRWLVAAAAGGLFLAGLFLHGAVGGGLLLLVTAMLVGLTSRAWAGLHSRGRAARVVVLAVVVVVAATKFASG